MLYAKDIMTRDVVTVTRETSLEELSSLLVTNEISGAPVVDESGALVCIVTENDLISRNKRLHIPTVVSFLDAAIYLESSKKFEEDVKRLAATKVGDICKRTVVTITEDTSLIDIATLMDEKKVHLLPVVRSGKVVGIVRKARCGQGCCTARGMMFSIVTEGPEQTWRIAEQLGLRLAAGDTICLYGDLGAGKTSFSYGIALGLQVKEKYITSPTFAFVNEYEGRVPLYHIDLYRLKGPMSWTASASKNTLGQTASR